MASQLSFGLLDGRSASAPVYRLIVAKRRIKADCRADTRGGSWAGIPVCLTRSAAYRACSVHSRAILVELVSRMNGYNNGKLAVSQRELVEAIGCSPRKVVRGIAELMEHGLIDVEAQGKWKERMAREYRLTFVSTKTRPATNDYLHWKPGTKSGATALVAGTFESNSAAVAGISGRGSGVVAKALTRPRKIANPQIQPASDGVSLIIKPCVGPNLRASATWWTADRILQAQQAILGLLSREPLKVAA
jgi:hypothetical protein